MGTLSADSKNAIFELEFGRRGTASTFTLERFWQPNSVPMLSLGRVFQFHVLCWLQASFRDMGQNSALRRPVDSATCGPELKQSLGLKSACKEPPNGFKGAPASNFAGLRLADQHWQASEAS